MLCPSCHKQTPDNGAFCLKCGAQLPSNPSAQADWEHKDFVFRFPKGMWVKLGPYTELSAKLEFWQSYQRAINVELQKWQDDGWESIGGVDSGCIEIRTARDHRDKNALYWILLFFFSLETFEILLILIYIFGKSTFAEPVKLVAPMRRLKPNVIVQPPNLPSPGFPRLQPNMPAPAFPHIQPNAPSAQAFSLCPRCAHNNRVGAKFCQRCGQKM